MTQKVEAGQRHVVCHCALNAPSNFLARTSTTTIPLTFLKIKSNERQQSRKGCESLMGWVGGVNARVCDVIANRTSTIAALYYSRRGVIILCYVNG
eukprot:scaffold35372_cov59-Attheya_sp.AAC.6